MWFPPEMAAQFAASQFYPSGTPPPRPPQAEERRGTGHIPPASALARARLPQVIVTKEDLLDFSNQECAICLDEQHMSGKATKLPCGHLFCRGCITDWLTKNCSCPTCRFELPTGDADYERNRRHRMQDRKAQYRIGELMSLSVKELRNVLASHQVRIPAGACEKREMIDALMTSHDVVILPEHDSAVYTIEELEGMSREQIVNLFKTLRLVTPADSRSKEDLLASVINSDRIKVDLTRVSSPAVGSSAVPGIDVDMDAPLDTPVAESVPSNVVTQDGPEKHSVAELKALSVSRLKKILAEEGIALPCGAIEKNDLVQLVPKQRIRDE